MKIAIIGTGFAGLATSWFLTELGCRVTCFDVKDIGQGASGHAAGLLHPYVGEQTRRSLWADEAIAATKALLLAVAPNAILEEGILRFAQNAEQREALSRYSDVDWLEGDQFLIRSGIVVDTVLYLQRLLDGCLAKGTTFVKKEITDLNELSDFDQVIVAAGHEIDRLLPQFHKGFSKIKGQILRVLLGSSQKTIIAKGYLARSPQKGIFQWGATYERDYLSEEPDLMAALALLHKKDFPLPENPEITDCYSGVRLARRSHYIPLVDRVKEQVWCFSGLGSRGLLYHAFLGKKLAEAIYHENSGLIPDECRMRDHER